MNPVTVSVTRTLPLRVRRGHEITGQRCADPIVKVVKTLENYVVVVLVECDGELVQEAFGAQHALEGHLEFRALDETDPCVPRVLSIAGQREPDDLELHGPAIPEKTDRRRFCTGIVKSNPDSIRSAAVENRQWRTSIDKGAH